MWSMLTRAILRNDYIFKRRRTGGAKPCKNLANIRIAEAGTTSERAELGREARKKLIVIGESTEKKMIIERLHFDTLTKVVLPHRNTLETVSTGYIYKLRGTVIELRNESSPYTSISVVGVANRDRGYTHIRNTYPESGHLRKSCPEYYRQSHHLQREE